jgi:hypothetical protein
VEAAAQILPNADTWLEISTQVEIDVLTGATTILRSDLVYDCGQSLNPAVDLGQVSPKTKDAPIEYWPLHQRKYAAPLKIILH